MNIYPYRWWCAVILGLLLSVFSYFYVLNPQVNELLVLQHKEKALTKELGVLRHNKIKIQHVNLTSKMSQTEWMTVLPTLAQLNGVVMRSITVKPTKNQLVNEVKVKFSVEGAFAQLARFIIAMHEQAPNGLIENFSYQLTKQETLLLTIELLLVTDHLPLANKKIEKLTMLHNPFCLATNTVANVRTHAAAVSGLSLKQMKMTGSFSQGKRQMALIMLPTSALVEVYVGDEVGSEKGEVIKIATKQIEMVLPSGEKQVMRME